MGYKVIIYGGIGSGKSTVTRILSKLGAKVFLADEYNAKLLQDVEYVKEIEKFFPWCIKDGLIQKDILAQTIYNNEVARQKVMSIAHPLIYKRINEDISALPLSFIEIPLYPINGIEYQEFWHITANDDIRIDRVIKRSGYSKEKILSIIKLQQVDLIEKNLTVIENSGDLLCLEEKIKILYQGLLSRLSQ